MNEAEAWVRSIVSPSATPAGEGRTVTVDDCIIQTPTVEPLPVSPSSNEDWGPKTAALPGWLAAQPWPVRWVNGVPKEAEPARPTDKGKSYQNRLSKRRRKNQLAKASRNRNRSK